MRAKENSPLRSRRTLVRLYFLMPFAGAWAERAAPQGSEEGNMQEDIVQVEGLYKAYGKVRAVQGISFRVERGSLFSFLGVNGAGKSTTINILCSILQKDAGSVRICGMDLDGEAEGIKRRLGIVFQNSVLDDILTVKENLTVRAGFYGLTGRRWRERLAKLCGMFELEDILSRPFGKLSGGQRRRADIARGLIGSPELLILDDPTTGLDPATRRAVWEIVRRLQREEGMTVFLTTHYMEEAEGSDRVVIIDGGKIAAEGTPVELKNRFSRSRLYLYGEEQALLPALEAARIQAEPVTGGVKVSMSGAREARSFLQAHPELSRDFEFIKGNMDDVFLAVTGKQWTDGGAV